ncbi:MAG: GNAT family N-acetyltransferase [Anaerolineae bacterium]|nr:GNAT family N-acetyltransferase [Anaerolineae bacterium]
MTITTAIDAHAITIRPLRRGDVAQLQALHQRLSADTIYRRYLSPRVPSRAELEQICRLNEHGGGALAVVYEGTIIGGGYYVSSDGRTAEPALLIEDRFQGQGLGTRLAAQLGQHAIARGIDTFVAAIYPDNRAVMRLIRASGLAYESALAHGIREVHMRLGQLVGALTAPQASAA